MAQTAPNGEVLARTQAIGRGLRDVFRVAGRCPRAEYVPFVLFILALGVANVAGRAALDFWFYSGLRNAAGPDHYDRYAALSYLSLLAYLVLAILLFSSIARRMHDIGHSARWAIAMYAAPVLFLVLPIAIAMVSLVIWPNKGVGDDGRGIGSAILGGLLFFGAMAVNLIVVVWLCFKPSQPSTNSYGPNPSEASP
jgi:uncharacterized membrane protein YhaH (DUF805 family)